jgi:phage-related tail fiber protein
MAPDYYCLVTAVGQAKLAVCAASGGSVQLTHMALGDGNGESYDPLKSATALVREVYRNNLHNVAVDLANPNWVNCEMVLPPGIGGWYIREAGLYDTDGDLIVIGKYPPTYKPILNDGTSVELVIRMIIEVTDADTVQMLVDPDVVMASQTYVGSQITIVRQELSIGVQLPGGTKNQRLAKASDADGDFSWVTESVQTAADLLPGGATGQVLTKVSDADGDVTWASPINPYTYFIGQM